ncbi:MAG: hybrid sensor histidine kinase/response regulator [Pseudomonadota bacterium]
MSVFAAKLDTGTHNVIHYVAVRLREVREAAMQAWGIAALAIGYLLFLFVVASWADRRARRGRHAETEQANSKRWSRSVIYALSLAIYCTSWTFFGSVGMATLSGLDFLAIYLGPLLVVTLGHRLLLHIIAVAKRERITSVADFIASRYGKSSAVGAFAAIIAVLGTVPYIALQLKAISTSVDAMVNGYQPALGALESQPVETAFFVSLMLALFAILFGTRHADATEHQEGLVLAVALESIIKLVAFLAVGLFVTFSLFDGMGDLVTQAQASDYVGQSAFGEIHPARFAIMTALSFFAFLLLPRQFHVAVVENRTQHEVRTARWLFPAYLVLINLFVLPVAAAGMVIYGQTVSPDSYVLALPLRAEQWGISILVFIGGLSAATAMVIVACVALGIMISNNIVLPLMLRASNNGGAGQRLSAVRGMESVLLRIRRTAIFLIMVLAYGYFQLAEDSAALSSIGLLSFAAIAQFAPAFLLGLVWRRPTNISALAGMGAGFATWVYTLFLPTVLGPENTILVSGPLGLEWLRPQGLFGFEADPLNHGVIVSLLVNTLAYCVATFIRRPRPLERHQAGAFFVLGRHANRPFRLDGGQVELNDLKHVVSNYMGRERCQRAFDDFFAGRDEKEQGRAVASDEAIAHAEQVLASAIGAASSRLVISLLLQKHEPAGESTIRLLDDASEALQQNRDLLQTALDQVEQGISVFDSGFTLSNWNAQFRPLLGLPVTLGQAGMPLSIIAQAIGDRVDGPEDMTRALLEADKPFVVKLRETGRVLEVQSNSMPDGGIVISWNDVTERTKAANALQLANETLENRVRQRTEELTRLNGDLASARAVAEAANIGKTKFLAAVGHDILQPLNAARLYASSLVEQLENGPHGNLARNIDVSLESVEDILGAVLAISRLDSGALTPSIATFEVARLLDRLEVEFAPIAAEKGLKLIIRSNDFHVTSDFSLLRRLLQNLISNAIKYTAQGTVVVDAKVQRNQLVFAISDTGTGISEADQKIIFDEFKRLDAGRQVAEGLGLGLSIVKRLAATLDHAITLTSVPGQGSTFSVAVPLAVPKPQEASATIANIAPAAGHGPTVLCVDNEPRILDGMKTLLGGWGCVVHTFENTQTLMHYLETAEADVLIADYHLVEETGLETIAATRQRMGADFPCILLTADRSAALRTQTNALEITLLNKPLKPAALRATLAGIKPYEKTAEQAAE